MNAGPAPRPLDEKALTRLLAAQQFGTLATNKTNGRPHLSTVLYGWTPEDRTIRISTTAERVKVRQLRRDPRSSIHVPGPDQWSFAVAEGETEISPLTTEPGDTTGRELLGMMPPFDRPEDEEAFLRQVVADRRVVLRLRVDRLYGTALDIPASA